MKALSSSEEIIAVRESLDRFLKLYCLNQVTNLIFVHQKVQLLLQTVAQKMYWLSD